MSVFFSDKTRLHLPEFPHSPDDRYEPIGRGKPLCVEIIHMAFGNVKDWWGKSEILVSSWAKTGEHAAAGARAVNVMRTGIDPYDHLSNLGAAEYGHQLVYYTPNYQGGTLRLSIEYSEVDKLKKEGIQTLGRALQGLAALPIFQPELAYLALAPEALELARKAYNIINRNDRFLFEHLDLTLSVPDSNVLSAGRYVLVRGGYSQKFTQNYSLNYDNKLYASDRLAEEAGLKDAYAVLRIDGKERPEYKDFEATSTAQEIVDAAVNEKMTESLAGLITDGQKAITQSGAFETVIRSKRKLDSETDADKKKNLQASIDGALKLLTSDQADLLKPVLGL